MTQLNDQHPDFKLTYELALIEHLGLNLYTEVPAAISELIANAYDAEAETVEIRLPVGTPLGLEGQTIVITDDGHGMTYDECRDKYLRIGRNRRRTSRLSKTGVRAVIGKKGIGKLAGFGIANKVSISTVSESKHTEFTLSFADLEKAPIVSANQGAVEAGQGGSESEGNADAVREYRPDLIKVDEATSANPGTTVTLSHLRQLDSVDLDDFVAQLARKFAIFGDDFVVTVVSSDGVTTQTLTKFDVPCQFRFPTKGWTQEDLKTATMGTQKVKFWIGFQQATIKDQAVRGISVIANGKSVQEPFDFHVTGGTTGQFGLQYMTGEVHADWLDDRQIDVIASDRSSVRWSDPDAHVLLVWGRAKVRTLLEEWSELRAKKTTEQIKASAPDIFSDIEKYQGEARKELEKLVDRVAVVMAPLGADRTQMVVRSVVTGFSHTHIREVLKHVANSSEGLDLFVRALDEWELVSAVLTFQELSVKLEAIDTLRILIKAGATEVKSKNGHMSLSEHLAKFPWLLDPMFREMHHELNVDNFVEGRSGRPTKKDDKRADFIVLYDSERVTLVELKSAKDSIDSRGILNLQDYHRRLKLAEAKRDRARTVRSILVYNGKVTEDAAGALDTIRSARDEYEVWTWGELLDRNTMIYKEQLKHVKAKNPTDPRVIPLWELIKDREGSALGAEARRSRKGPSPVRRATGTRSGRKGSARGTSKGRKSAAPRSARRAARKGKRR